MNEQNRPFYPESLKTTPDSNSEYVLLATLIVVKEGMKIYKEAYKKGDTKKQEAALLFVAPKNK